jgi:hypothetical protein
MKLFHKKYAIQGSIARTSKSYNQKLIGVMGLQNNGEVDEL